MYQKILKFWNNLSISDRYKLLQKVYGNNIKTASVWIDPEEEVIKYLEDNSEEMEII